MIWSGSRKPRFFYGYVVVTIALCIFLVADGIFYSFGVFFEPVLTEFNWTRMVVSGAFSVSIMLLGLLSIGIGKLNDRFGPRILLTGCGFFLGLGYMLLSQIDAVWQLYLFFGVLIGIGESAFIIPLQSTVARWFVKRRGMMTGIATAGIGLGQVIMPPVSSQLISIYGWRISYIIVGIIALVFIILAAQFLKRDPGQMGLSPYGENESEEENLVLQERGVSLREAMNTRRLWLLSAISFCHYFSPAVVMVHVVIHATGLGIAILGAANILAIIGVGGITGRVIMGVVADRIGNKLALIICFILMSLALVWLMVIKELWMFYSFAAVFGIGYGGISALRSPVTAELFGLKSHGVILGLGFLSSCIGGVIGPVLA
ncbi:MFS transporter, partial [Chloroflexota bacterium]